MIWPDGVSLRIVGGLPQIVIEVRALHQMGTIPVEVAAVLREPVRYVHARFHEDAGVAPWPCCRLVLEQAIDARALLLTFEPREGTPRWEVVL